MKTLPPLPVANICDALARLGYPSQTVDPALRPLYTPMELEGPAWPVRCYAGATWALEQAIEEAPEGSVLMVDGGGFGGGVLMGGLMGLRARKRGLCGAVIDGAVRDTAELRAAGWPIFKRFVTPRAGTHDQQGEWGRPLCCGGASVAAGDWIVGDDDGVVVIPVRLKDEALRAAREIQAREEAIAREIERGYSLALAVARLNS